jgi:hypothetical protein
MDDTTKVVPDNADEQPPASPADQSQGEELSPEELEWNRLGGRTQDRVRKLISKAHDWEAEAIRAREELELTKAQALSHPSELPKQDAIDDQKMTPEQELAIENLRKFGVWTKKDQQEMEARQQQEVAVQRQQLEDEILIKSEYTRLANLHNGKDGLPRFDEAEIENHMKQTGVYNPEKAYDDLYRDEIFDSWAKEHTGGTQEPSAYSERPSGSVSGHTEPLTLEGLRERLREKDGKIWWDQNRERLLPLLGDLFK